jgi:hypothetical protein
MTIALVAALFSLVYVNPIVVVFIWATRLGDDFSKRDWRGILLLVAQLLLTIAVAAVWFWIFEHTSLTYPEDDKFLRRCLRFSAILASAALIAAATGKGPGRKSTIASSVFVFLNWLAVIESL